MALMQTAFLRRVRGVMARAYHGQVPQGTGLPYARVQTISGSREQTLEGPISEAEARMQIDVFAATHLEALTLANSIAQALTAPATESGIRFNGAEATEPVDGFETVNGTTVARAMVEVFVHYSQQ